MLRTVLYPVLVLGLTWAPLPSAGQELVGFQRSDFGNVVLNKKQFAAGEFELSVGSYNNESIRNYSPESVFARMGRAVGRLDILTDKGIFPCTAFIVDQTHLVTNHHCVPGILENEEVGATRIDAVQFVAGYTQQGITEGTRTYTVSPTPVETSKDLDYAVLEVLGDPSAEFGILELASNTAHDGDPYWIIGHPMGEAQRISREQCKASAPALSNNRLLHTCDTLPGNSGSPVIDASLQKVVALHHAGSRQDAVNFAIPMNLILEQSAVLKASAAPAPVTPSPVTPDPQPDPCDAMYTEAKSYNACFAYQAYADQCTAHPYIAIAQGYLNQNCGSGVSPGPVDPPPTSVDLRPWCEDGSLNLTEQTICTDPYLADLDAEMEEVFLAQDHYTALSQRAWARNERDACNADVGCIANAYTKRIAVVAAPPAPAPRRPWCSGAGLNAAQRAICADDYLADLDADMEEAFQNQSYYDQSAQRAWARNDRDACGANTSCIASAYAQRISTLENPPRTDLRPWCSAASLNVTEKTICSNEYLAGLDEQTEQAFYTQSHIDWTSQNGWMQSERDGCGANVSCIASAYQTRISLLKTPPPPPQPTNLRPWCSSGSLNTTERTICSTEYLAQLDEEMEAAFFAQSHYDWASQRPWLQNERDACGANVSCIASAYQQRISVLRNPPVAPPPVTGDYVLPANQCYVVVAARRTLSEATDFIYSRLSDRSQVRVFKSENGYFGITYRVVNRSQSDWLLQQWKSQNLIPGDSYCAGGERFVSEVSWQDGGGPTNPPPATTTKWVNNNRDGGLNLRQGPSTAHGILDELAPGTRLTILSESGKWSNVRVDGSGQTGWVATRYLVSYKPDVPQCFGRVVNLLDRSNYHTARKDLSFLAMRAGPSANRELISELYQGDRVKVLARNGNWARVQCISGGCQNPFRGSGGETGWSSTKYLTIQCN